MSTATADSTTLITGPVPPDLRIYSHSPILYWWPVWAVGFVMALWTYLDGHVQVLAPEASVITAEAIQLPPGGELLSTGEHVARSRLPGVIFVVTLLAITVLSHSYLRGPWSLFIGACVVALLFLIGWLDWWGPLWRWLKLFSVHINLGGYLVISTVLFAVWALNVLILDRRRCLIISTGQVRIRDELGDEEQAFDTASVAVEKRPFDWFRWVVGFGAGDLVVRTAGPNSQEVEFLNVIHVGRWINTIQQRLRTRDVV